MYHMYSLILTLSTDVCMCVCILSDFRTTQSEHELIQQAMISCLSLLDTNSLFIGSTVNVAIVEQASIILIK